MSVVDQLILDNHRRQLLKSLQQEEVPVPKSQFFQSKSKNSSFNTFQAHPYQTKNSNFSFKLLNNSFLTNPDPQQCADRLYSDAYLREKKLKKLQEEKSSKEIEAALDSANFRHPKRKLDPEVFNRLTQDERLIRHLYEKENHDSQFSNKSSRRFSSSEQKESVDRLCKTRGKSCAKNQDLENSSRKLNPEELKAMIERLYHVKKTIETQRPSSATRPRRRIKKEMNELKSSKRYIENLDRLSEFVPESVSEVENGDLIGLEEFRSPDKCGKTEGENLEVRLLKLTEKNFSPVETEVNTGSPMHKCEDLSIGKVDLRDLEGFKQDEICDEVYEKLCDCGNRCKNSCKDFEIRLQSCVEVKSSEKAERDTDGSVVQRSPDCYLQPECPEFVRGSSPLLKFTASPNCQIDYPTQSSPQEDFPTNSSQKLDFCINLEEFSPETEGNSNAVLSLHQPVGYEGGKETDLPQSKTENPLKSLPFPKSFYLEPEDLSAREQSTTYSQESLYLMQNPLQSIHTSSYSPEKSKLCILDSYRFIVGISENDEFIYAD